MPRVFLEDLWDAVLSELCMLVMDDKAACILLPKEEPLLGAVLNDVSSPSNLGPLRREGASLGKTVELLSG